MPDTQKSPFKDKFKDDEKKEVRDEAKPKQYVNKPKVEYKASTAQNSSDED